jgi:hypothetical protein
MPPCPNSRPTCSVWKKTKRRRKTSSKDALREALNVICGNLLPRIGGTEAVYDIQAPGDSGRRCCRSLLDQIKTDPRGYASALLSLDDGGCQLYMRLNVMTN